MLFCFALERTCFLPFALDSLLLMLVHWSDTQTELGLSCTHVACVWLYTVSKVLPCSLTAPGGLGAGLKTADLPAPLQGKISYQAAAALCPAVWGLCQGFLHKCTGVHQAVGGKRRWRWGEAFGPSSVLWHVPQKDWTSSVKALIKDHFQVPQVGRTFMRAVTKWR